MAYIPHIWHISPIYGIYPPYMAYIPHIWHISPIYGIYPPYMPRQGDLIDGGL
jgi:hypothetical protein